MKTKTTYLFFNLLIFTALLLNNLNAQTTAIPDPNFEQALIDLGIDSDGTLNGQVLTADIANVTYLAIPGRNISNLSGIENFTNLEKLIVRNNNIQTMDFSANTQLKRLNCLSNPLNSLNLTNNVLLDSLTTGRLYQLNDLDLSNNINLKYLDCSNVVDISNNVNLEYLRIPEYAALSIDISNNINLKTLIASFCPFSQIDLSNNTQLEYLDLSGTPLTSLDLSNNIQLKELYLNNEDDVPMLQLTSLDCSNNVNLEYLHIENVYSLETINLKNEHNDILSLEIWDYYSNGTYLLSLNCIQVDDEVAANNGQPPYSNWPYPAGFVYSEDCSKVDIVDENWQNINLYPNPVKDQLYIENIDDINIRQVKIYDTGGKLLCQKSASFDRVDLSSLPSGLYFVKIETDKGGVTKKIFKE